MFELACLLAIILVFGVILSFFNIIKIKKLENELFLFKLKFTNLSEKLQLLEKKIHTLHTQNDEKPSIQTEQNLALKSAKNPHFNLDKKSTQLQSIKTNSFDIPKSSFAVFNFKFENFFTQKFLIIVAGLFLVLAGLFLIKYSIENSLITPLTRLILATFFGLLCVVFGLILHFKKLKIPKIKIVQTNLSLNSQILISAGFVIEFLSVYAAFKLYDFIGFKLCFVLLCVLSIILLFGALKFGVLCAYFGLIGAFATPVLLSDGTYNGAFLFGYLFVFYILQAFLSHKKNFIYVNFIALLLCVFYILHFIFFKLSEYEGFLNAFVLLFMLCIACFSILLYRAKMLLFIFSLCLSFICFFSFFALVQMSLIEWTIFGLLVVFCFAYTYLKNTLYNFLPLCFSLLVFLSTIISLYLQDKSILVPFICFFVLFGVLACVLCFKQAFFIRLVIGIVSVFYLCSFVLKSEVEAFFILPLLALVLSLLTGFFSLKFKENLSFQGSIWLFFIAFFHLAYELLDPSYLAYVLAFEWALFASLLYCETKFELLALKNSNLQAHLSIASILVLAMLCVFPYFNALYELILALFILSKSVDILLCLCFVLSTGVSLGFLYKAQKLNKINFILLASSCLFFSILFIQALILASFSSFEYAKYCLSFTAFMFLSLIFLHAYNKNTLFYNIFVCFGAKAVYDLSIVLIFDNALFSRLYTHFYKEDYPQAFELLMMIILSFVLPSFYFFKLKNKLLEFHKITQKISLIFDVLVFVFTLLSLIALIRFGFWYFNENLGFGSLCLAKAFFDKSISTFENYTYSFAFVFVGVILLFLAFRNPVLRIYALLLFAISIIKLFFIDISSSTGVFKILLFFSVGVIFLLSSYFYSKKFLRHK
ncbi:DUF2339 domain-containing protein [Campylobacter sp. MIT 19-121]|uniref:DUF2339 domain-containing protein n=1 Tax=Campylobacter sp. MIT 19-121 TaxID=2703906 RepID=UPI00138996F4|nr:DUF2339 domain-containing protein [Campylobacter sp. MIT 19-121]NDJ27452.1 DUF2339 domain-containing protein [Campylobacter sp. MIT 19-121]